MAFVVQNKRSFNEYGFDTSSVNLEQAVKRLENLVKVVLKIKEVDLGQNDFFYHVNEPLRKLHDVLGWGGKGRTDGSGLKVLYRTKSVFNDISRYLESHPNIDRRNRPTWHPEHTIPISQVSALLFNNGLPLDESTIKSIIFKYSVIVAVPGQYTLNKATISPGDEKQSQSFNPYFDTFPLKRYKQLESLPIINTWTGNDVDLDSYTLSDHFDLLLTVPFYNKIATITGIINELC